MVCKVSGVNVLLIALCGKTDYNSNTVLSILK